MLIKRNNFMTTKARSVKKLGFSFLGAIAICTTAMAPNAFAGSNLLVDKTVTMKIYTAELQSEDGVQKIYAKLKKKAKSFCRSDGSALYYLNESVSDCSADLLGQFVQSADIAALKAYHLSEMSSADPKKFAFNTN